MVRNMNEPWKKNAPNTKFNKLTDRNTGPKHEMPWNMNMPWTWIREHKHTACTTSRAKHAACTNATNADNSLRCEHKKWLKAAASATKTSWQLKTSQAPQTTKTMKWMGGSAPQTPAPAELPVNSSERRLETHSQSQQKTKHRGQRKQASWSWSQIKSLWQGLSLRTVHSANSTTHPQTNSRHGHKWGNAGKTYYVESCAKFWRRRFRRKSPKNMGNSGADVAFEPERQQTSWHHHLSSS